MRRNHLLKYTAVLFLAGGLFAAMPCTSFANNDVGKGASKKYMQSGSEQSSPGQSGSEQSSPGQGGSNWQDTQLAGTGEGTDPGVGVHGSGVTEVAGGAYASLDDEAPAATGAYGYSREDAQALCDYLYGIKTDPVKREIAESILMNSIWYDPQNIMKESGGKQMLKLYEGPKENYKKAYLEALDGLEFFPNPTVMFLQDSNGKVIVAVETGSRFTEEQAAAEEEIQVIPWLLGEPGEQAPGGTAGTHTGILFLQHGDRLSLPGEIICGCGAYGSGTDHDHIAFIHRHPLPEKLSAVPDAQAHGRLREGSPPLAFRWPRRGSGPPVAGKFCPGTDPYRPGSAF